MSTRNKGSEQSSPALERNEWDDSPAVDEFMRKLDHPLRPALEEIRAIILAAERRITEGIKWNAPSFYCNGWFVTINLSRDKTSILVVFHKGAKVKDNSTAGMRIKDNAGLLEWVAKERCLAKFAGSDDVRSKKEAFKAIVSQWAKQMVT